MAHSKDGINWTVDKDPKAYSKTVEWEDGTIAKQGQLERPFILLRMASQHSYSLQQWMVRANLKTGHTPGTWLFR